MRFLKLGMILSAVAVFVFACSQNTTNTNMSNTNTAVVTNSNAVANQTNSTLAGNDELAAAGKIYSEKCINCHKADGSGGISTIEGKQIKAPNFHSQRLMNDKDADWIDTIENGAKEDGMPAFKGDLSEQQIKDLVKYIHVELQGKK